MNLKLDMAVIVRILVVVILTVSLIEGARILAYFPTPSISHQVVFRPLIHSLAKRGHEVIVVTTDPAFPKGEAPVNLTEIDVHDITYKILQEMLVNHTGEKKQIILQAKLIFRKYAEMVDQQMNSHDLKEILKNKDKKYFDVLILEACNRPLLGISHMFDAPIITFSSFGAFPVQYEAMGAPLHHFLYPTAGRQRLYNLTILEKGIELAKHAVLEYIISTTKDFDYYIMRKNFGEDVPTFEVLSKKIKMMFLNEHPLWADNHPVPPSIVYIGGIHQAENKDLPKDLKEYMDSSKHGVIYVSFGTNVLPLVLPPEKIEVMTKVLSELPYDVLWKWDNSALPGQSKNIKTATWFPQTDLLKHPNMKLFITQGGLQSTDETIDAAVPVIGIPMLGDQWYNVEKYVHHKIGKQLDITTLTEKEFRESVKTVIEDESYKKNVLRLRSIMREHPIKPVDNAVWWTEHIIKYGGDHLKCPAAGLSWTEYYEVNLILIILGLVLLVLAILTYILKKIYNFVCKIYRNIFKVKVH